jgi:hypothetical protein
MTRPILIAYLLALTSLHARVNICSERAAEVTHLVAAIQSSMPIIEAKHVRAGELARKNGIYCTVIELEPHSALWIRSLNYELLESLVGDNRSLSAWMLGPSPLCTIPDDPDLRLGEGLIGFFQGSDQVTYPTCDKSIRISMLWGQGDLPITVADEMTHAALWIAGRPFEHCLPHHHDADCEAVDYQMRLAMQEAARNTAIAPVEIWMKLPQSGGQNPFGRAEINGMDLGFDQQSGDQGENHGPAVSLDPSAAKRGRRNGRRSAAQNGIAAGRGRA